MSKNVSGVSFLGDILLGSFLVMAAHSGYADGYLLPFGNTFSGYSPAGTGPWSTAYFADVSPGTVRLTISASGLTGNENIDQLYFNLNPALSPADVTFTLRGTSGQFELPTIAQGANLFKGGGDGKFDFKLLFSTVGAETKRFTDNESLVYNISGIPGLTSADFMYLSLPASDNGPFYSVAHVQRISGDDSGWIYPGEFTYVPEPSALGFAILAGCAWLCRGRYSGRK